MTDHGKNLSTIQKTDAALKEYINHVLWKDDVLRAEENDEIDVYVKNGVVYLSGHIVNTTSKRRIEIAILAIPGVFGIINNLVLDDMLTLEVAALLEELEHTYGCKFFIGVSHGVVVLNGKVSSADVRARAEQCAASHSKVRGVINYIHVPGVDLDVQDHLLLQPTIGKEIYFRDGISGIARQVVINPNNRRVISMIIQGHFDVMSGNLTLSNNSGGQLAEQLIVVPMSVIEHLTKSSGFLTIQSTDYTEYQKFDPSLFTAPNKDWEPPYPYCPDDVLFPIECQQVDKKIENVPSQVSPMLETQEQVQSEEILANDSLGG